MGALEQACAPPPVEIGGEDLVRRAKRIERQGEVRRSRVRMCDYGRVVCGDSCSHDHGCDTTKCGEGCGHDHEHVNLLQTMNPEYLNAVVKDGWEEVELTVDSGASETIDTEMVLSAQLVDGGEQQARSRIWVANGIRIPNLSEESSEVTTEEGTRRGITTQVCEVNKPGRRGRKTASQDGGTGGGKRTGTRGT